MAGGRAVAFPDAGHESINLSESDRKGLSLVATMRLDTKPTEAVEIGVTCGPGCAGRVGLRPLLEGLEAGRWTRVAVPLKCFEQAGADLGRVTGLFELGTSGSLGLSFSRVALGNEYDHVLDCAGE